jgi:hypothetical protein
MTSVFLLSFLDLDKKVNAQRCIFCSVALLHVVFDFGKVDSPCTRLYPEQQRSK